MTSDIEGVGPAPSEGWEDSGSSPVGDTQPVAETAVVSGPSDPMEALVARALIADGIPFTTDPRQTSDLDFRILNAPVFIEVKQFHSDRIAGQMARVDNVIAVQGRQAVTWFAGLMHNHASVVRLKREQERRKNEWRDAALSLLSVAADFITDVERSDLDDLDYGRGLADSGLIERFRAAIRKAQVTSGVAERAPKSEGWVEWHGGENPVPGARVEVRYRNGRSDTAISGDDGARDWKHDPDPWDIIAYRVVTPGGPDPMASTVELPEGHALSVPTPQPVAGDVVADLVGLEAVRRQVTRWVDYDVQQRANEGLSSSDDTHLISPPTWPSHGQLRSWVDLFSRVERALSVLARVEAGGGLGSNRKGDLPTGQADGAVLTGQMLEAIAHNLCSLHDFDPAFVAGQERFARAVITEYERARPAPDFALDRTGMIAAARSPLDTRTDGEG